MDMQEFLRGDPVPKDIHGSSIEEKVVDLGIYTVDGYMAEMVYTLGEYQPWYEEKCHNGNDYCIYFTDTFLRKLDEFFFLGKTDTMNEHELKLLMDFVEYEEYQSFHLEDADITAGYCGVSAMMVRAPQRKVWDNLTISGEIPTAPLTTTKDLRIVKALDKAFKEMYDGTYVMSSDRRNYTRN